MMDLYVEAKLNHEHVGLFILLGSMGSMMVTWVLTLMKILHNSSRRP